LASQKKNDQNQGWNISYGTKKFGEITLQGNKLFFCWAKARISPDIVKKLRQHVLVMRSADNSLHVHFSKPLAVKNTGGRHHGLDVAQVAPENVTHLYPVDPAAGQDITMRVKSPFPQHGLMQLNETKRTRSLSRKLRYKEQINRNIAVVFDWEARVKKANVGVGPAQDMVHVNQKITYSLGGGKKDLPLNERRVRNHEVKLRNQLADDKVRLSAFNKEHLAKQRKVKAVGPFDTELAFQVKLGNEIKALSGKIKNTNKRMKIAKKELAAIELLLLHLEDLEDAPFPYQVSTENAVVAESAIWNHTEQDCVPLLGKWQTLGDDHLTVALDNITTIEAGKPWHHDIVRMRFVGPCSTDSNDLDAFAESGKYVIVIFGLLPTQLAPKRIVRREFVINKNDMDVAEETRYEILRGNLAFMEKKHVGWNRFGPKVLWHRKKP